MDQLILLERIKSNYFDNRFQKVNFPELLISQTVRLESQGQIRKINLKRSIAGGITLYGVEIYLANMCHNLLDIAFKFSQNDSTVQVAFTKKNDKWAILHVRDNGPGIAKEDQDQLFEPFYQMDQSRTAGFGLGLSLARGIVELHKGKIHLNSNVNLGTNIEVKIPLNVG